MPEGARLEGLARFLLQKAQHPARCVRRLAAHPDHAIFAPDRRGAFGGSPNLMRHTMQRHAVARYQRHGPWRHGGLARDPVFFAAREIQRHWMTALLALSDADFTGGVIDLDDLAPCPRGEPLLLFQLLPGVLQQL